MAAILLRAHFTEKLANQEVEEMKLTSLSPEFLAGGSGAEWAPASPHRALSTDAEEDLVNGEGQDGREYSVALSAAATRGAGEMVCLRGERSGGLRLGGSASAALRVVKGSCGHTCASWGAGLVA